MSFGDFNRDGHTDGRDYIQYKMATENESNSGIKKVKGNMGCLTFVLVILGLYIVLEIVTK